MFKHVAHCLSLRSHQFSYYSKYLHCRNTKPHSFSCIEDIYIHIIFTRQSNYIFSIIFLRINVMFDLSSTVLQIRWPKRPYPMVAKMQHCNCNKCIDNKKSYLLSQNCTECCNVTFTIQLNHDINADYL